jgi:protein phosphatase-4 regulatory subunit 3
MQQRESLTMLISQNDCQYLKSLLSLFQPAETKGDYGSLATLAACIKTILLLNDPSILEMIVNKERVFEDICAALEYDPDLRDKANHRWFLRERAKFRTVALMEDDELVGAIHRSFRVNYLKDTLLRPTMDESSLSTLASLQTFTHADVVKGVTMSPVESDDRGDLLRDSYLAKVIRILGHEMDEICSFEWKQLEALQEESSGNKDARFLLAKRQREESLSSSSRDRSTIIASGKHFQKVPTIWKQHLAPQDDSMASRRIRRRGSLSFLRELFNMVRVSLHQTDKDDFFAVLVSMEVDLSYSNSKNAAKNSFNNKKSSSKNVNFLLLLATVLSDPETDVTDKGLVLEIIAGIAMHDPSLIRRKCLDFYASCKSERLARPMPNGKKQVVFQCPPNDLLASLLFLLAMETDAGVLLQVSEIMRIILDTDVMGDNRPMNTGFADEAEGIPPSGGHNPPHDQHPNPNGSGNTTSTEQNQFLSAFYEHYVQWLAAPFQFTILYPLLRVPTDVFHGKKKSQILQTMVTRFEKGSYHEEPLLHRVPFSTLRSSFAVELLSFCVRAHQYRMKMYLLRSRVLGKVLKLIKPSAPRNTSGDRCLKLAALRFLRAVLSVEEDSYHRHIIQDDLLGPVFEAFRANPVGDNLVSSSIVEMCDFINSKNIHSLIEYIVTKHISVTGADAPVPSLEDVSSPYVSTLTCLRQAYETLVKERNTQANSSRGGSEITGLSNTVLGRGNRIVTNEKALEDQRKFRKSDQEESYFDCDDDDDEGGNVRAVAVDPNTVINPLPTTRTRGQQLTADMHKTPRMFSLTQADISSGNIQPGGDGPVV